MNYSIIRTILGHVIRFEGAFLLIPVIIALIYGESSGISFSVRRASGGLYTLSSLFKVTWLQKNENAAVMRIFRRN